MRVVWDEPKRLANLAKHGLDFAEFGAHFDFGRIVALEAKPSRTGRPRFILIGRWSDDRIVVALVSPVGTEAAALISLRPASKKERAAYEAA